MFRKIFLTFLLLLPITSQASSDYAISFEEFKKRLSAVFDEEQFSDLRRHLPEDFEIWGYDVGDFSNDGDPDIALSLKSKDQTRNEVQVYFFVSDGHSFIEAMKTSVRYFEIPIEVAFTIENGMCFMTRKERDHHWYITAYAFRKEDFLVVDRFEVGRRKVGVNENGEIGYELYHNYSTLTSSESFFNVTNGKTFLKAQFYTFPVYRITKRMLPGYAAEIRDTSAKYFLSGKESWKGARDLSFSAKLAYDDSALYCTVNVVDDSLVVGSSTSNDGDRVELWFDVQGNRINLSSGAAPNFRFQPDSNVLSISISPGDFKQNRPRVNLILRRDPSERQQKGIKGIGVVAKKRSDGYMLQIKIPLFVFDLLQPPTSLGFTAVVNDVDNSGGAVTRKSVATSQLREWDPSSFGVLRFLQYQEVYGEVRNFGIERILHRMKEVGL